MPVAVLQILREIPEEGQREGGREEELVGAFLYPRICQGEVGKAQEFQTTQKKARFKCFGHLPSGLADAERHSKKHITGICLPVEVRRRKRKEEIGVPVVPGRPHPSDLTSSVQALPP